MSPKLEKVLLEDPELQEQAEKEWEEAITAAALSNSFGTGQGLTRDPSR